MWQILDNYTRFWDTMCQAFFEMHVKIDSYELTFNKLSPTDATIFFHEYIHFFTIY